MKFVFNVFLVIIVSCLVINTISAQNWGSGENGTGSMVKKELKLDKFLGVDLGISGDVILTKGSTQKVTIEGQQNIIDLLKTDVSNGKWKISFTKNVSNYKDLKIYITIPSLTAVGVSGSGNINSTNSFDDLDDLSIYVSGSGNIDLDVSARSMNTRLSGSGNIYLKGASGSQDLKISGSGNIKAYDLKAENANVHISGSGSCQLNVSQKLDAKISGSGDISYKGDPNVKAKVSGSGDVRKKD